MPRELRCPGWHSADGETHHTGWRHRSSAEPAEEYYCKSCEAAYPYLVDVAKQPPRRHSRTPKGPVHKDDPTDYGSSETAAD